MAAKKTAQAQPDDLLAQLDSLSTSAAKPRPKTTTTTRTSKPTTTSQSEQDLLAELGNLAQRPSSRPATPSLKANNPAARSTATARSPTRTSTATPPPGRMSEDKSLTGSGGNRKSGDSTRSSGTTQAAFTPATTSTTESPEEEQRESTTPAVAPAAAQKSGGGWWGGILSTATAAVSQAQAAVKEIQRNEEAQRWAEQMRGNVGALRGLGNNLQTLAMPTFQNILQTIAPPISSHERLQIHITHDLSGYPTLDPLIYSVFSRVMAQVEGGDLMVIQKGQEAAPRRDSESHPHRPVGGWNDGPWWRSGEKRSINAVKGVVEGSKLARASAEGFAGDFFADRGGVEEAAKKATETLSESNPTRSSEIFLAIQAVTQPVAKELFVAGSSEEQDEAEGDEVLFAIYLHDPIHGIAFYALSQPMPGQWIEWLDASAQGTDALPESIQEIIESGGVDPREWVSEWIEETLSLGVGVVAQRYVAKRMGVGEGGVGKGKMKADRGASEMIESGGGEASRALGGM